MHFSGYSDGFVKGGSTNWENEPVIIKAQKDLVIYVMCRQWEMLSLCQASLHVSGSGRKENRDLQMKVDFLTSHISVRYTQVNTECTQLMVVN